MHSPISLDIDTLSGSPLPISLDLLRQHVAVDDSSSDTLLTQNLLAAIRWAEGAMRRTVFARRHVWTLSDFPYDQYQNIRLPRGKTQSVISIGYTVGGQVQTLTGPSSSPVGNDYQELLDGESGGLIRPLQGHVWPAVDIEAIAPVQIEFVAGWQTDQIPKNVIQAILYAAEDMFDIRGSVDLANTGTSLQARQILISPYRIPRVYAG